MSQEVFNQDQLCQLMGYETPGLAERKLIEQGIRPIYGRKGRWFVTLAMINAARGIRPAEPKDDNELI